MIDIKLPSLESRILGRNESYFSQDLATAHDELTDLIKGSRILVIGGAGSIGFQTLRTVLNYGPRLLHIIDHNENGLAETVRALRTSGIARNTQELLTLPFDYGAAPFQHWFEAQTDSYDHVLNFAALKHVRSEKDPYSILAMLETNVYKLDHLAKLLAKKQPPKRLFCVSTDKAANPSSMMGATKRLMEHALFSPTLDWDENTRVTSARFANVAFSNGSLLQSWQLRLAARQPMACPEGTRRFFVSLQESGHLCTLAGFVGESRGISVPTLDPGSHLALLSDVAAEFLAENGLEAYFTHDENEALERVEELSAQGKWPVLLTPLDTAGEKPYEEFVGDKEVAQKTALSSLLKVPYLAPDNKETFPNFLNWLQGYMNGESREPLSMDMIKQEISKVEESFARSHVASSKSLDQRI